MERIKLYHGGEQDKVMDLQYWGLNHNQPFYCTRVQALAEEAQRSHGLDGRLLELDVPKEIFEGCLAAGYWEERPYMGCMPIDHSTEVVVNPGEGTEIMNKVIATEKKIF